MRKSFFPPPLDPEAIANAVCTGRKKVKMQPLTEKLIKLGLKLGPDVKIKILDDMIQLWRNRLFAHLRPSSRYHVDIGVGVGLDTKPTRRLERTGIVTGRDRTNKFRIRVWKRHEVDAEVKQWLQTAYDADWRPRPRSRAKRPPRLTLPIPASGWKSSLPIPYALSCRDDWVPRLLANFKDKTGRSLEEWQGVVKGSKGKTRLERIHWLLDTYNLSSIAARVIVDYFEGRADRYSPAVRAEKLFSGTRAGAGPLYDRLMSLALPLGADFKVTPLEISIALRRNRTFAQVRPSPWELVLDLVLPVGMQAERLKEVHRRPQDRTTHRVAFKSVTEIDDEVAGWLKAAYERDAQP